MGQWTPNKLLSLSELASTKLDLLYEFGDDTVSVGRLKVAFPLAIAIKYII